MSRSIKKARVAHLLALWHQLLSLNEWMGDKFHALLNIPELSLLVGKKLLEQAYPPDFLVVAKKVPALRKLVLQGLIKKRGKFEIWHQSARDTLFFLLDFPETRNGAARELLEVKDYNVYGEQLWKIVHQVPTMRQEALKRMIEREDDLGIIFKQFPEMRPVIWKKALRTHTTCIPNCRLPRTDLLAMIMRTEVPEFKKKAWDILLRLCKKQKQKGWPGHWFESCLAETLEYIPDFRTEAATILLEREEHLTDIVKFVPDMREMAIDMIIAEQRENLRRYSKYTLKWLLEFCTPTQKKQVQELRVATQEEILEEILIAANVIPVKKK